MALYLLLNVVMFLFLTLGDLSHSQNSHFKILKENGKTIEPIVTSNSYAGVSRAYSSDEPQNSPILEPRRVPGYDLGSRNDINQYPDDIDRIYFPTIHVQRYKEKLAKEKKKKEKEEKKKEKETKSKEKEKMKESDLMAMHAAEKPTLKENTSSYLSYNVPGHGQYGGSLAANTQPIVSQGQNSYSRLPYQSAHPGTTFNNGVSSYQYSPLSSNQEHIPTNTHSQGITTTENEVVSIDPKVIGMGVRAALLLAFIIIIVWIWITDIFEKATGLGAESRYVVYERSNSDNIVSDFLNSWGTSILQSIEQAEESFKKMEKRMCNGSILCYIKNFLNFISNHKFRRGHFSRYRKQLRKKARM